MQDETSRIAVVIPCHDYGRYVGRAIASVTSQGCASCELVVVDDGSTDDSWDVIGSHEGVNAIRMDNGGVVRACLAGAAMTTAPHLLVLDADDELAPGSLGRILSMLDGAVSKLQFSLTPIDAEGNVIGSPAPRLSDFRGSGALVREIEATGCYTTSPTSGNVFRRDVLELLREEGEELVDGLTVLAAPFLGEVASTGEELGRYRIHGSNMSGLGAAADASRLRGDARTFADRLGRLARVLDARGIPHGLPAPADTFFHRERSLYADMAQGLRPSVRDVVGFGTALRHHPMPPARKVAVMALAAAALVLPTRRSRDLLDYRLTPGRRSAAGMLRRMLAGGPPHPT